MEEDALKYLCHQSIINKSPLHTFFQANLDIVWSLIYCKDRFAIWQRVRWEELKPLKSVCEI